MQTRSQAREVVLLCLFQWDQREDDDGRRLAPSVIRSHTSDPEVEEYASELLEEIWAHLDFIDEKLRAAAENWRLERMAVVDRNVLRLAVAELYYVPSVPAKVSLDEAIELAKKYSTEKSGSFVNGILDRILTEREKEHGPG